MSKPTKGDRWLARVALVDGQVSALMEHFESVQIIVTTYDDDGTFLISRGGGNYFARIGSVGAWMDKQCAAPAEDDEDE